MLSSIYYMTLYQIENRIKELFPNAKGGRENHNKASWYINDMLVATAKVEKDGNWYIDELKNLRFANY